MLALCSKFGRRAARLYSVTVLGNRKIMATGNAFQSQDFDYFLVLDFEATCESGVKIKPQEIIEFPVLKVNSKTYETEAMFHHYVQPEVHKELSSFCTELTGIVQDMVDGQHSIQDTLKLFDDWMREEGLLDAEVQSVFVTCGDWDLNIMLPSQARYFNFSYANYLKKWINIKKPFTDLTGTYSKGMMPMLQSLQIKHEGRHHSGIDDCRNITKILAGIAQRGYVYKITGHID